MRMRLEKTGDADLLRVRLDGRLMGHVHRVAEGQWEPLGGLVFKGASGAGSPGSGAGKAQLEPAYFESAELAAEALVDARLKRLEARRAGA